MKTLVLAAAACAALALSACGPEVVDCGNGVTFESCEQLDVARAQAGSGTQSSASLELCWENQCDETQPVPQY